MPTDGAPLLVAGAARAAGALARALQPRHRAELLAWPEDAPFASRRALLKRARAASPRLIVVLDESDERTLVAALLASEAGRPTVAVVADPGLSQEPGLARRFGLDAIIDPVASLADALIAEARGPLASALAGMKQGGVVLMRGRLTEASVLPGAPLRVLGLPKGSRVAAITRGRKGIAPGADTVLASGDELILVANAAVAPLVRRYLTLPADPGPVFAFPRSAGSVVGRALADHVRAAGFRAARRIPASASRGLVRARLVPAGRAADRDPLDLSLSITDSRAAHEVRLSAVEAVARRVAAMLPPAPVERIGALVPGRLDVYLARAQEGGQWLGYALRDIPRLRGWTVLAIEGNSAVHLPHPEDVIQPGETVVLAGPPRRAPELTGALVGPLARSRRRLPA